MSRQKPAKTPITLALVEHYLDWLAMFMADEPDGGVVYLPIYHRLEAMAADLRTTETALDAVRRRAAAARSLEVRTT